MRPLFNEKEWQNFFNTRKRVDPFELHISEKHKQFTDSYSNKVLGLGKYDERKKFNSWDLSNDANNWALWLAIYNDNWIFRRAIDKPAEDVANLPLKFFGVEDVEQLGALKKHLNDLKTSLTHLLMWGALFGGSVGVMLFDNIPLNEMYMPLNVEHLREAKSIKLIVLDRWNGVIPSVNDVVLENSSDDFLKPKFYDIKIGDNTYKVHYTYVLRYEHRRPPNLLQNGQLMGWGLPEGCHILNEIMRDEKLKNSISTLIDKSLIEVIKMKGMRAVFMGAGEGNTDQLENRVNVINWSRNFNSLTFLDAEDDYQQNEFGGLGGLADLMEKNMETIAAALEMTGVLYGDMSGGFSPDNYSLVRYDTTIRNRANNYFRLSLKKLINVLKLMVGIEENIDFEFESMIQAQSITGLDKLEKVVDLISRMISDGYMTPEMGGREISKIAKEVGVGETITDEFLNKLKEEDGRVEDWEEEQTNLRSENEY